MIPTIAILVAGSPDLRTTGEAAKRALSSFKYNVVEMDIADNVIEKLKKVNPDLAFIALHNPYYTEGRIQGLLEILGVKYTHSGVLASAVAANKVMSKHVFQSIGIDTPTGYAISRGDILENNIKIEYPYVLKPINESSSLGVHVIFSHNDYLKLKNDSSDIREEMLLEEFVPGVELYTAVLLDEAVGTIEIRLKNKTYYDYEAKHRMDLTERIFPADIPRSIYEMTLEFALKAHKSIGCKTVSRSDFRYNPKDGSLKMLEINAFPALDESSGFLQIVRSKKGIDLNNVFDIIVKDSLHLNDTVRSMT